MTREELEKEAIKCMHEIKYWLRVPIKKETEKDGISEILKLTEPREKRIAELEDKLANANYQLEGRDNEIRELEAQIERMKCCQNCNNTWNGYHLGVCNDCKNHNKWELRR